MQITTPRQALSKAYLKSPISRPDIERFKEAFVAMKSRLDKDEQEEHLKNVIRDFLLDAYYKGQYEINVKERKDLVIHNGNKTTDDVAVIIEAKSFKNKAEMVSKESLNKKAMQELLLYYMRERMDKNNIHLKQLIITNAFEWFVFDAVMFEKIVFRNTKFVKEYKEYKNSGSDTRFFYEQIAKPFIDKIEDELTFTYFDIGEYKRIITNEDQKDDRKLVALFKLLSPTHILKLSFANDSNSLNKNFYNELLHIIGLEEVSQKGKKIIQRKAEDKRESASLLENTLNILRYETSIAEAKHYDTALELCITWVNRILFLKLLESQLVKYHQGDTSYQFLKEDLIANYDALNRLFFQVLAVQPNDRRPNIREQYRKIPYLNSSLFEVNEIEARSLKISGLEDDGELSIYSATVLRDSNAKRAKGTMTTLTYLFRFLDAYNFSSDGGEQIQEENKSLINASVLGLIFEKINGYKDGSFFTPGFITMYMSEETIRRAILQKYKEQTDFDSEEWADLKNFIGRPYKKDDLQRHNAIIDDLKICDPAVGSGHFLVSALNEIIAIKSDLGILCDRHYEKLPVIASVDNDELIIINDDRDHELYEYDFRSKLSQQVQEALFYQKQQIIENCLFGVDINPNSVKICRLRLWIELLKNAYYTSASEYTDLETLPNIDINIKCGNSLISRFGLDSDLKPALKKSKFTIDAYKSAVASYKQASDKEEKRAFKELIATIKDDFRSTVSSKEKIDLQKLEGQFFDRFGGNVLIDVELTKAQKAKKDKEQKKLMERIQKKKAEIEDIQNNVIYHNAFEWRFEFPEVLDDEGKYVGFDVVIGNPPYISAMALKKSVSEQEYSYLKSSFLTAKGTVDIYVYFFEQGLKVTKQKGFLAYITPNRFLSASYGRKLREFILNENKFELIGDYSNVEVFKEASTYPVVTLLKKCQEKHSLISYTFNGIGEKVLKRKFDNDTLFMLDEYILGFVLSEKFNVSLKVFSQSDKITEAAKVNATSTTAEAELFHNYIESGKGFKLINTGTIDKYTSLWGIKQLVDKKTKYLNPTLPMNIEVLGPNRYKMYSSPKIIFAKIAIEPEAFYDQDGVFASINTNCLHTFSEDFTPEYLLAWVNSKLYQYSFECLFDGLKMAGGYLLYSAPNISNSYVKRITKKDQEGFVTLVNEITSIKKQDPKADTSALEAEIDRLVYELYELTAEEIALVEEAVG